jgi:hypothetical protein
MEEQVEHTVRTWLITMEKQNPTSSHVERNFSGLALPSLSILSVTLSSSLFFKSYLFSRGMAISGTAGVSTCSGDVAIPVWEIQRCKCGCFSNFDDQLTW